MNLKTVNGVLTKSKLELNLKACLRGGMSFRWKQDEIDSNKFIGVIENKIYELIQNETKKQIEYRCFFKDSNDDIEFEINNRLNEYFRLDYKLEDLYKCWSKLDSKFDERVKSYPDALNGIRVLYLNPVENLFSFICSSNNNIKRISQMILNMCNYFGKLIGNINGIDYYEFPTIERLSEKDVESKLRELKFGYRAKFIYQAACYIKQNHSNQEWLFSLREKPYEEVHRSLVKIPGIGKKVADCIALMSLNKLEAIPVDTHVLSIAKNQYNFIDSPTNKTKKTNNLTDKTYKEIGDKFRDLWGENAGWAQTIMFIDDLKGFKNESKSIDVEKTEEDKQPVKQKRSESLERKPTSSKPKRQKSN